MSFLFKKRNHILKNDIEESPFLDHFFSLSKMKVKIMQPSEKKQLDGTPTPHLQREMGFLFKNTLNMHH